MFLTFRQISTIRFALYAVAQLLGAFVGALITYIVYCGEFLGPDVSNLIILTTLIDCNLLTFTQF
jgi:glycerol uptake facilitator-like aquaporin